MTTDILPAGDAAHSLSSTTAETPAAKTELVFIDTGVADYQTLVNGVRPDVEVVLIASSRDGMRQIAEALAGRSGIAALHVLSHGTEGMLALGSSQVTLESLDSYSGELATISRALAVDADVLLYGCHVACGSEGRAFVDALSKILSADVAASTTPIGSVAESGNWVLDANFGTISTSVCVQVEAQGAYPHVLGIADENFDTQDSGLFDGTSQIAGSWTFTQSGTGSTIISNSGEAANYLNVDQGSGTDKTIWLNTNGDSITEFSMKSTDGTNFALLSLKMGVSSLASKQVTITAYSGGVQVGAAESVTLTMSASSGGVAYTVSANDVNGTYGILTFGSAYSNIDELRFSFSGPADPFFDDIDVSPAVTATSPTLIAAGEARAFTEGGSVTSALFSSADAKVNDSGQTFTGMTLTVTNVGGGESLNIGGTSVSLVNGASSTLSGGGNYSVSVVGSTATVTLTNLARNDAAMNTLIQSITYNNVSQDPGTASRVVSITQITDSGSSNNTASPNISSTVNVTPVNDAPTASNLTQSKAVTEGGAGISLDDIVVSEVDTSDTITATLTLSNPTAGVLSAGTYGSATATYNSGTGVWTVTGSVVDVNAALAAVTFTPSADNDQNFTITTRIRDASDTGPADGTIVVSVTPVNDAPVLAGAAPAVSIDENTVNATPQLLYPSIVFSDAEGNFDGGQLTVSGLLSEDRISIKSVGAGSISVDGSSIIYNGVVIGSFTGGAGSTFDVTFNSNANSAAVDSLIEALAYSNVSQTPTTSRTLLLDIKDGAGKSMLGPANVARFALASDSQNPFTIADEGNGEEAHQALVDLDEDGDLDLVVADGWSNLRYYRNDNGSFARDTSNPITLIRGPEDEYGDRANMIPAFTDLNGDGYQDLVVAVQQLGIILAYQQNPNGTFTQLSGGANPFGSFRFGQSPDLTFVDINSDGRSDLVVGDNLGYKLRTFVNTGNGYTELTGVSNPLSTVNEAYGNGALSPSFIDLDGDGDLDVVVGNLLSPTLRAFERQTDGSYQELTGASYPFPGYTALSGPKLAYFDVDGDGDLDAVMGGTADGRVRVFQNTPVAGEGPVAITVKVNAQNDAPAIGANLGASTAVGNLLTITSGQLNANDPDDAGTGLTYTVTDATDHGTLFRDGNGNGVIDGGEALGINSTFTQDDINQGRIKYLHGGGAAGTGDSFTFSLADGSEDGAAPVTGQTFSIAVAARPVVTQGVASAPAHTEDGAATAIAPALVVADDDSAMLTGATVTVTDLVAGDVLNFAPVDGIIGSYNASTGVLTLSGPASVADYQAALRTVTYSTTSNNPSVGVGNADRVISVKVTDDGGLESTPAAITLSVVDTNDAPVLDITAAPALNGIAEDLASPTNGSTANSTLVSALLGGATDVDAGALQGIAVVGVSAQGTLWYSIDGGANWAQVTAPLSATHGLVLHGDARLYFEPAANLNGTVTDAITFRAWDRTDGQPNGATGVDTTSGSSFSTAVDTASVAISSVNDAPILTDTPLALDPVAEDVGSPVGAMGTLVSSLVGGVSDADPGALPGIAIIGADTANGTWFYSTDNGAHWQSLGTPSAGAGRLLLADAGTRVYFRPATDYQGTVAAGLTIRAWDGTSGTNGGTADVTSTGGATAFSAATDAVSVTVTPTNDAPVLSGGPVPLTGTNENGTSPSTLISTILASVTRSDADPASLSGLAVTGTTGNGLWQYSTNGAAWTVFGPVSDGSALLLSATTRIRFVGDGQNGGLASLTFRAWDQTTGTASANGAPQKVDVSLNGGATAFSSGTVTAQMTVTSVNDAPTLSGLPGTPIPALIGQAVALPDLTVADVDTGAVLTVTLSATGGTINNLTDADPGSSGIQLTGTVAALNTQLAGATFTATAGGAASIGISVSDGVAAPVTGTLNLAVQPGAPAVSLWTGSGPDSDGFTNDVTPVVRVGLSGTGAQVGDTVSLSTGESLTLDAAAISAGYADVTLGTLTEGPQNLTVTLTAGGITSVPSPALTFTVDIIQPMVAITSTALSNDAAPVIRGTAEVGTTITLSIGGATYATVATGGSWSVDLGGAVPTSGSLALNTNGPNLLQVTATDMAGNTSAPAAQTLFIDTTSPEVAITSGSLSNDATPVISGTAETGTTITLLVAGATYTTVATDGTWSLDLGSAIPASGTLALDLNSANAVSVTATDAAGNVSDPVPHTLTLDTRIPAQPGLALASDTGPSNTDGITSAGTVTVSGLDTGATWQVSTNGGETWQAGSGSSFMLIDGTYAAGQVRVRQSDAAGNVSLASVLGAVTVDSSAPELASASVTGDSLSLVFDEAVDAASMAGLTVWVDGEARAVTGLAGAGSTTLTLTLAGAVRHDQTVQIGYDPAAAGSAVANRAGLELGSLSGRTVSNATPQNTVDGVVVESQPVILPGGSPGRLLTIPVVTASRQEQSGNPVQADIPLVSSGATPLLLAQLPVGYGLIVSGADAPQSAGSSLADLIRAIQAWTPTHAPADQGQLTGGGAGFLQALSGSTSLLVQTIAITAAGSPGQPLVLSGIPGGPQTALVIDTASASGGAAIQLQNVDFAAIIGQATVSGGAGSQVVFGDGANQSIVLGADDDELHGGGGDDYIGSHGGNDWLYGDDGNDTVSGGEGNDWLFGGSGYDRLLGGTGHDRLDGGSGHDKLYGNSGNDTLSGGTGNDSLWGGSGQDRLDGGAGNDTLKGEASNDRITGGLGRDTLWGGSGRDVFDFNSVKESKVGSQRDVIYDFRSGQDRIDLRDIDANELRKGNQKFSWTGSDGPFLFPKESAPFLKVGFTGKAGELRYDRGILMGDTDGDGRADFQIKIVGKFAYSDVIL